MSSNPSQVELGVWYFCPKSCLNQKYLPQPYYDSMNIPSILKYLILTSNKLEENISMLNKEISNSDQEELFVKRKTLKEELDIYYLLYQEKATGRCSNQGKDQILKVNNQPYFCDTKNADLDSVITS